MARKQTFSRRAFLTGAAPAPHHVSSAVVMAQPARIAGIVAHLDTMPGVEVHASEGSRIVVTIEGPSTGALGEALTAISLMDGVIAANMVFEHIEEPEVSEP